MRARGAWHGVEQSPPNFPALTPERPLPQCRRSRHWADWSYWGGGSGVPVALTLLSPGGGSEGEQEQQPQGLRGPRHCGAAEGPDPAPRGGHSCPSARHRSLHPGPRGGFYWAQEDKCHQVPWQRGALNPRVVAPPPRSATSTRGPPAPTGTPRRGTMGTAAQALGRLGGLGAAGEVPPRQCGSSAVLRGEEADLGLVSVVLEERLHAAGAGFARWVQLDGRTEGRAGEGWPDGRRGLISPRCPPRARGVPGAITG